MIDPKRVEEAGNFFVREYFGSNTYNDNRIALVKHIAKEAYQKGHADAREELMREIEPVIEAVQILQNMSEWGMIVSHVKNGRLGCWLFQKYGEKIYDSLAQFRKIKEKR